MDRKSKKIGNLHVTLATFVYILHEQDLFTADETLCEICDEIHNHSTTPSRVEFIPDMQLFMQSRLGKAPSY
jgi:hypothetical protein